MKLPTGIETLDDILGGGFPQPSAISILGDVGSGKSTLCVQIMWNALMKGTNVLLYLTTESRDEMRENLLEYGVDLEMFEREKKIKIVDLFSRGIDLAREAAMDPEALTSKTYNFFEALKEGRDFFFKTVRGENMLAILNSLSPIFLTLDTKKATSFLSNLKMATRVARCVGIATLHTKVHDEKVENIVRSYSDGIIELNKSYKGDKTIRRMRISKMRGGNYYRGDCEYSIGKYGLLISKTIID